MWDPNGWPLTAPRRSPTLCLQAATISANLRKQLKDVVPPASSAISALQRPGSKAFAILPGEQWDLLHLIDRAVQTVSEKARLAAVGWMHHAGAQRASLTVTSPSTGWEGRGRGGAGDHDRWHEDSARQPLLRCPHELPERLNRPAPEGSAALRRWRMTLEELDEQLSRLRSSGYRSISLRTWRDDVIRRRSLAGRAAGLTFDDGYADFDVHARPLLERHKFTASLFVVTSGSGTSTRGTAQAK